MKCNRFLPVTIDPNIRKREIAFRGLMACANDGCTLTGDVQKEKYVYYRCTGHRGKCDLPRFREEHIAQLLRRAVERAPGTAGGRLADHCSSYVTISGESLK